MVNNPVKNSRRAHIHNVMTHLHPNLPLIQTLCLLLAVGCSARVEIAKDDTGGAGTVGGGTAATGGSTGTCDTGRPGCVAVNPFATSGGITATGGIGNGVGTSATGGKTATGGSTGTCDTSHPGCVAVNPFGNSGGSNIGGSTATGGQVPIGGVSWDNTGGASSTAPRVCTPGADQTCNDNPAANALWGHCEADAWCSCNAGYVVNPSTGKCNTPSQTVCYSPTQNIDKAYIDRAFGCDCNSTTSTPYCGIDSNGLLVYMACNNGQWRSGNTGFCTDPETCFSPTQNAAHALESGAVGCTCDPTTYQAVCVAIETDGGVIEVDAGIFESDAGNIPQTVVIACTSSSSGKWIAYSGELFGCQ